MAQDIDLLIQKMCDKQEEEAFNYADQLAEIGGKEVLERLVEVLKGEDMESAYLAARGLAAMENNDAALDPLLEVIHDKQNKMRNGTFVQSLEGFDLSDKFVDILRVYLFGNFKASLLAKEYLDYTEFEITPRVIRKAEKHWKHFQNNSANDQEYDIKKQEIEEILGEMRGMFDE
ncbi:HEAT repeat domain-containing protein [Echinicola soli]|uniref:HEAT repeat domain-containing protein n=1 Tax=Echinicola soli TaxID=2591634 RepID=A0A514CL04_9BACT|nr:HEAT repeat domain-containing protein [Echinicola soli]QDH80503.1 HEAT repeat domain-containing protein [Echinicola soli]